MYEKQQIIETSLTVNNGVEGETIETKMERVLSGNEPITDGAPIIYTERKDGIFPEHNIRTDKNEIALEALTKAGEKRREDRQSRIKSRENEPTEAPKEPESGDPSQ